MVAIPMQDDLLKFKVNITMGKKCNQRDVVAGAQQHELSISETIYWDFHAQPYLWFTEKHLNKRIQFSG